MFLIKILHRAAYCDVILIRGSPAQSIAKSCLIIPANLLKRPSRKLQELGRLAKAWHACSEIDAAPP